MAGLRSLVLGEGRVNIPTADASEQSTSPQGGEHVKPDKTSSRPIRAVGLLLILQAIGLVGLIAYGLLQVDWQQVRSDSQQQGLALEIQRESSQQQEEEAVRAIEADAVRDAVRAIVAAILFLPSIVLAILAALGFLIFSRRGWLLASLAQTLSLGACMEFYYDSVWEKPGFVYPVMLYCTLMILYLNSSAVRVVFHSRRKPAKTRGQDLEVVRDS
jgi:cation transport ATPase